MWNSSHILVVSAVDGVGASLMPRKRGAVELGSAKFGKYSRYTTMRARSRGSEIETHLGIPCFPGLQDCARSVALPFEALPRRVGEYRSMRFEELAIVGGGFSRTVNQRSMIRE